MESGRSGRTVQRITLDAEAAALLRGTHNEVAITELKQDIRDLRVEQNDHRNETLAGQREIIQRIDNSNNTRTASLERVHTRIDGVDRHIDDVGKEWRTAVEKANIEWRAAMTALVWRVVAWQGVCIVLGVTALGIILMHGTPYVIHAP